MKILFGTRSTKARVFLATAVALALGVGIGLPRIANAAPQPGDISISDVSVTEGTGGAPTAATFTVSVVDTAQAVSVNYATQNVTATGGASNTGSTDYVQAQGTLNFLAHETSKTVTINVTPDSFAEPNETFNVHLSSPSNGQITKADGVGTISNDDGTVPTVQVNTITAVAEGNPPGTTTQ